MAKGFALWDKNKLKKISSLAGKRSHALGKGHEWTPEEASKAGLKSRDVRRKKRKKHEK